MSEDEFSSDSLQIPRKRSFPSDNGDEFIVAEIDANTNKKKCDQVITIEANQNEEIQRYQFAELSLKPIRKKSDGDVWKYFGIAHKNDKLILALENKIICKQCFEKRIWKSYSSTTSVTSLSTHLQNEHSYVRTGKAVDASQNILMTSFFNKLSSTVPVKNHPTIKTKEERERFVFFRYIVIWICRDLLPFNMVCGEGFNVFWNKFNLRKHLTLPSRTTVAGQALDDAYTCIKQQLLHCLEGAQKHGAITFDCWTDSHRRTGYITFTYHFITKDWTIFNTVLKTSHFEAPHSGERIKTVFNQMLFDFNLQNKKIVTVTDGGSNMKASCRLINVKRITCIAHQINRLIQFDLFKKNGEKVKPILNLIEKLRKIQRTLIFKHGELSKIYNRDKNEQIFLLLEQLEVLDEEWVASEKYVDTIDSIEKLQKGSFNGLKSFSVIRWNCVYALAHCHDEHKSKIKKCLEDNYKHDLVLSLDETALLSELVNLLKVFQIFTKFIQGNGYATQNLLPIFYSEVQSSLKKIIEDFAVFDGNSMAVADNDTVASNEEPVIITAAKILLNHIDERLKLLPESIAAAIVDPAMQHLPVIDHWLRKNNLTRASLIRKVCQELDIDIQSHPESSQNLKEATNSSNSTALCIDKIDNSKKPKNRLHFIESLLQSHCPGAIRYNNTLEYELQIFREAPTYTDVIEFWKKHHKSYPKMAACANVVLFLPLTTSKSEGEFSVSGCVVRSRRATITPTRVEKVLFVHDNFHLFEK